MKKSVLEILEEQLRSAKMKMEWSYAAVDGWRHGRCKEILRAWTDRLTNATARVMWLEEQIEWVEGVA